MSALRNSLGDKLLTYEAINLANRRRICSPYLQSGGKYLDTSLDNGGDFLSSCDGRAARMFLRVNLPCKLSASFSFDPVSKTCPFCPGRFNHPVLGSPKSDSRRRGEREAIMLGDQALPPLLPSCNDLGCIRIIRIEFGSLADLVSILLEQLDSQKLAPSSIILLFSMSHIAQVGVAAYIEDLVAAKIRLRAVLGADIYVSTAPPCCCAEQSLRLWSGT